MDCQIKYKGKDYTYDQFAKLLHSGELEVLAPKMDSRYFIVNEGYNPFENKKQGGSVGVGGDVEIGTTDNTNTILEKAEKKGGIYSELAKAIKGFLGNVKTVVTDAFKSDVSEHGDYGQNEIAINNKTNKNKLHIFFHEALHHITREKIQEFESNPNSKNLKPHEVSAIIDLKRIFKKVTEELNKQEGGFGTQKGGQSPKNMWLLDATGNKRGLANVHEFISEAFTNPEFQKILKDFKGEGKSPTIFKQFLDAVAKMLGLKDATILDDIFHHTEKLTEPKAVEQSLKETTKEETPTPKGNTSNEGGDVEILNTGHFGASNGTDGNHEVKDSNSELVSKYGNGTTDLKTIRMFKDKEGNDVDEFHSLPEYKGYRIKTQKKNGGKLVSIHFEAFNVGSNRGGGHGAIVFEVPSNTNIDSKLIDKFIPVVEKYKADNYSIQDGKLRPSKKFDDFTKPDFSLVNKAVEQSLKETPKAGSVGVGGDVVELSNGVKLIKTEGGANKNIYNYNITDKSGQSLGYIEITDKGNYYQTGNVEIKKTSTGLGTLMYSELAKKSDKPIYSDPSQTDAAKNLWERLVANGVAERFKETVSYKTKVGVTAKNKEGTGVEEKQITRNRYRTKALEQSLKVQPLEQAKKNLSKAWNKLGNQGIVYDPLQNERDFIDFVKALFDYVKVYGRDKAIPEMTKYVKTKLGIGDKGELKPEASNAIEQYAQSLLDKYSELSQKEIDAVLTAFGDNVGKESFTKNVDTMVRFGKMKTEKANQLKELYDQASQIKTTREEEQAKTMGDKPKFASPIQILLMDVGDNASGKVLERITQITTNNNQERSDEDIQKDATYIEESLDRLRNIAFDDASMLFSFYNSSPDWVSKFLTELEQNRKDAKTDKVYSIGSARLVGILNVMNNDTYERIIQSNDPIEREELMKLRDRLDSFTNDTMRDISLGLNARRSDMVLAEFARGGVLNDYATSRILTRSQTEQVARIQEAIKNKPSQTQLNNVNVPTTNPTTPSTTKSKPKASSKKKVDAKFEAEMIEESKKAKTTSREDRAKELRDRLFNAINKCK